MMHKATKWNLFNTWWKLDV